MRFTALLSFAIGLGSVQAMAAESFVFVGKPGRVSDTFIGCTSLEKFDRLKDFIRQGDKLAAVKFAMANDCTAVKAGTTGMVESNSVWSNATCIRAVGETECVWVPMPLVVAK